LEHPAQRQERGLHRMNTRAQSASRHRMTPQAHSADRTRKP
jgi:hypothetical protein